MTQDGNLRSSGSSCGGLPRFSGLPPRNHRYETNRSQIRRTVCWSGDAAQVQVCGDGMPNNCAKATENDLGVMGAVLPRWNAIDCTSCDLCLEFCPVDAISKVEEGSYRLDEARCIHCSGCTIQCPTGAWEASATGATVWFGGTMGKIPRLATLLTGVVEDQEVLFAILRKVIDFYQREGRPGERFGRTIDRVGMEYVRSQILPNSTSDCLPVE